MKDLKFNFDTREIVLDSNGDFLMQDNTAIQNGQMILLSRCSFINTPMLGIAIEEIINGDSKRKPFEMNRWQQQCKNDGATFVKWDNNLKLEISYD